MATCCSPVYPCGSAMNLPSSQTFPPYTTASFSTHSITISTKSLHRHFLATCCSPVHPCSSAMNLPSSQTSPHIQQSHFPPDQNWMEAIVCRPILVFKWSDLQQDYLVLQSIISKKYLGTSWITGVIQIVWNHVYYNWEARNADLHGIDTATHELAQYTQAQRETGGIYSQCSLVQPRDRDVFYGNTNKHFRKESMARGLKEWLNT